MAILQECCFCYNKQSLKNKKCKCGADLDKAKRSRKVKYWITYRLHDGKQRRESVGSFEGLDAYSIEDAKDAEGKRRSQKRENKLFDVLKEYTITFQELSDWYLSLGSVQKLASVRRIKIALKHFNKVFGERIIGTVIKNDIVEYQTMRERQGVAPSTIDLETYTVKAMITAAFENDKLDGSALKAFRGIKRKLISGSNARKVTISIEDYLKLCDEAPAHFKPILTIAFNTGMRTGELQQLKWEHFDRDKMFIRLPPEVTKEGKRTGKGKAIPINHNVKDVLDRLPRALMHDYVFTYKGKPFINKNGLVNPFTKACKRAGISYGRNVEGGITMHDTRRTVKTNMLAAGIQKEYRDTILGHSLQGMDKHYLVPSEDDLKKAMDQYTAWLDNEIAKFAKVDKVLTQTS